MNEWLIERVYDKQLKTDNDDVLSGSFNATNNFSPIHEIVFLSKFIGFEHTSHAFFNKTPKTYLENSDYSQQKNKISLNKKRNYNEIDDTSDNSKTIGTELDLEELFDCVYITVTSNSLTPFI